MNHRIVESNGIKMHIAEDGDGPLVVFCHGFPELWYSWRSNGRTVRGSDFFGRLPCGNSGLQFQSATRKKCSHWRNSPLKPMLSATRKVAMTHRSISLLDFGSVAVRGGGLL